MQPEMLESPHQSPAQDPNLPADSRKPAQQNMENNFAEKEIRIPRRPGRPSLRGRGRSNPNDSGRPNNFDKDEDYEMMRQRGPNRNSSSTEESNMEGFIKIIDYLKKIDCDETSLHNKMNPYNLLTATCFWYIVSSEYFSFDFFNNRNPNDAAIQILRKAQKTYVMMPQRIVKPLRLQGLLDFETPQLLDRSRPITDRLTSLIKSPMQFNVEGIEKATYITSISEDDLFRSSTRAIIFNYLKKKLQSNQKWSSAIQPLLQNKPELPNKDIQYLAIDFQEEDKSKTQNLGTDILYRQKRKINPDNSNKPKPPSTNTQRRKKTKSSKSRSKSNKNKNKSAQEGREADKKKDDIFFHESDEEEGEEKDESAQKEEKADSIINEEMEEEDEEQVDKNNAEIDEQNENNQVKAEGDNEIKNEQIGQDLIEEENIDADCKEEESIKEQLEQKQNQMKIEEEDLNNEQIQMKQEQDQEANSDQQQSKQFVSKYKMFTKSYTDDDVLLNSIMHLPLDNVISLLQASLTPIELPPITKDPLSLPKHDPLDLVYQIHPEEQKFLEYMKNRQEKLYQEKILNGEKFQEKERQTQFEDAKCQVCTDGDYTEDNLIVFCSMCGISVHQRCVGLNKVPSENWICEVCQAFGPAGCNVPCPLCNVKGGALKRTSIHINQPLFKDSNPAFHEYSKSCPFIKQKEEYSGQPVISSTGQPEPYYDYFTKSTYPSDQPACYYVWTHYVCAIWVPQCYFEQKNGAINIKGIQNIDKKRFKQKCLVCEQTRGGACVKCENATCTKYYHPECARKKKIYMQQLNLDKLRYLIFCEAHEPLKVKRKIEIKKKKNRDEIIKFCRGIEKYVETYKIAPLNFKLMKVINSMESSRLQKLSENYSKMNSLKDGQKDSQEKVIVKIERNSDEDFIKSVIEGLNKNNQIIVNLVKTGTNRFKVEQIVKPSKRDMRKSLNRVEQFWKNFSNGQPADANLRRFNNIMRQNLYLKEKIENFINYGDIEEPKAANQIKKPSLQSRKGVVGRRPKTIKETIIEQQGGIFCVCRKPYCGETDMFQCEVCNEWYHHDCIGFVGSEEDAQCLDFHCMKCMKYESEEARKERLDRCAKFFSQDSLFLNYRPPTPSLQSEEKQFLENEGQMSNQNDDQHSQKNASRIEELDHQSQKIEKYQKPPTKTKILAILNKPFVIEGPHKREEDEQFFENKKNKFGSSNQKRVIEVRQMIEESRTYHNPNIAKQENKSALSVNFMQIESISFKGQFINQQKKEQDANAEIGQQKQAEARGLIEQENIQIKEVPVAQPEGSQMQIEDD